MDERILERLAALLAAHRVQLGAMATVLGDLGVAGSVYVDALHEGSKQSFQYKAEYLATLRGHHQSPTEEEHLLLQGIADLADLPTDDDSDASRRP